MKNKIKDILHDGESIIDTESTMIHRKIATRCTYNCMDAIWGGNIRKFNLHDVADFIYPQIEHTKLKL